MAGWLRRIFQDVELVDLPLQFHLDTDADGRGFFAFPRPMPSKVSASFQQSVPPPAPDVD